MTRRWCWYIIDTLIGAAIFFGACALIYASPIPMLATGQSCNKDERITCPSDPCHDPPCWRDITKPTAWGTDPNRCGKALCMYQFSDKATQRWRSVPVPPCTVECDP